MSGHSPLGPSGARRWMNCPGSVRATQELIASGKWEDKGNLAAKIGTVAHTVLEFCLNSGGDALEYFDHPIRINDGFEYVVDAEMVDGVQTCLDLIDTLLHDFESEGCDVKLFSELKLNSELDEEAYGTADIILAVSDKGSEVVHKIVVVDFKYGKVVVSASSEQLKIYGYMATEFCVKQGYTLHKDCEVELWISQPRGTNTWSGSDYNKNRQKVFSADELTKWFKEHVVPAMDRTRDLNAEFVAGPWCKYCPVKTSCPAMSDILIDVALYRQIEAKDLTEDELSTMLSAIEPAKEFFEACEKEAYARMMHGKKISGYKLVKKKANRVWKNTRVVRNEDGSEVEIRLEDAAREEFGDAAYSPPKIKGIPEIEKLEGGKKFVTGWVYKPEGGLTVVSEDDRRTEVLLSGEGMFG